MNVPRNKEQKTKTENFAYVVNLQGKCIKL